MSLFTAVEMAPRDPILGLNEQFAADTNPSKVNLGVGVYFDDNGKLPLLQCVQAAEKAMMDKPTPRGYLPIDGIAAYDNGVKALVFGADSDVVTSGRVATVQAIGGTGGLKIGADFLKKLNPNAKVLISNPSWENHKAIFTNAGFEVGTYAYYDAATRSIDFAGMLADLNAAAAGTVVVLHACCHNPTGYDITAAQWDQVIEVVKAKGLVAFLDMAYQGFGHGIAEDGAVIGYFLPYHLHRLAQLQPQLDIQLHELNRNAIEEGLIAHRYDMAVLLLAASYTMSFITTQIGMFSYSGLSKDQMVRLRSEFGVYGTDTGRMCVAALNSKNIEHVCKAIAAVM